MTETDSKKRPSTSTTRKQPWTKKLLRYGVPLIVSIGLCWILFARMDFTTMISTIRDNCRWQWIWLTLCISIVSHVVRAMRWRIQLQAIGIRVGLYPVVLSIFGTYAVNLVFPRLGELWRTSYIAQRQSAPFDKVFGSMVADRLADTITVGLLALVTFILAGPQLTDYLSQNRETYEIVYALATSPWTWAAAGLGLILLWALFNRWKNTRPVKAVVGFCRGLWSGFAVVATMPGRFRWTLLTLLLWGCYFTQLYSAFFAFPETAEMVRVHGIIAALLCFVFSSLSMGVPSNGGIGPWQWAIIFGISLFSADIGGLTPELAATFANLVMGTQTLLLIILGLFTFISIAIGRKRFATNGNKS
ncbi:MAG: flippase-like domain-containing protein [Paramuribaculum sp.]|nr:flippase-like domain-containing protein [Paramuribaculum sp.]MDE6489067.1 flippase-like domain-containing protein [Paramuribaculum sp.]